jgi:hypothetical protein
MNYLFFGIFLNLLLIASIPSSGLSQSVERDRLPILDNSSITKNQTPYQAAPKVRERKIRITWRPPVGIGAPYIRVAGGTRGGCGITEKAIPALIALHPDEGEGLTISGRPTLWLYVPQGFSPNEVQLSIGDSRNPIYQKTLPKLKTGGVVGLRLPDNMELMQPNERIEWQLRLSCNTQTDLTRGTIRRVLLERTQQQAFQQLPIEDKLEFYAEQGLWYETLTMIAERRRQDPRDTRFQAIWETLMKADNPPSRQLSLNSLSNVPIIDVIQLSH